MTEMENRPPNGGPEAVYFERLRVGSFQIQRCGGCERHVFFPRVACPHCGSLELAWVKPSGRGNVYSTTTVRRKPEAGGDYNVALVDLEEGVRMMSRVDGIPPQDVVIGMPVQAQVVREGDAPLVVFTPRGGAK